MDIDLFVAFAYVGLLILSMCSLLVFRVLTVAKIEKAIMSEGKPRPLPWRGLGGE